MKSRLKYYFTVDRSTDNYIQNHFHNWYEMVCYTSGCGTTKIGDTLYKYSPGSIALIPPNVEHDETHKTQSDIICLSFEYSKSPNLCGVFTGDFSDIITEITNEIKNQQPYHEEFLTICIDRIVFKILRDMEPHKKSRNVFSYAINYIDENYAQNINMQELAESLGYNEDYFRHAFKKIFLVSPKNHLIYVRIEQSKKLLIETDMSISDISLTCGFSSSSQFSLFFKKRVGCKPTEYRKAKKDK